MKVLHVIPSFYPATAWGGPIQSAYGLCKSIAQHADVMLRVLTTDTAGPRRKQSLPAGDFPVRFPSGYNVYYCRRVLGASFSPGLIARLWKMIRWADIVHLTAVYSSPTIPTLLLCKLLSKKVVWSPRGSFTDWDGASNLRLKTLWNRVCDKLCDPDRVAVHATSDEEVIQSRNKIKNATPVLIPNGVDLPDASHVRAAANGKLRLLFLGRLHPIKGLENLFSALTKVSDNVTLSVTGEGDPDYQNALGRIVDDLGLQNRISFNGPAANNQKAEMFSRSDVCVLPSFSENFGLAIAESLAHGVPVIASRNTPWKEVETIGCGLWVDNDPDQLAASIEKIKTMPLAAMGEKGRAWMASEFSWQKRGSEMLACYKRLLQSD
jgi:glycosyltransferase involved in cell wall biosynthesis